MEVPSRAPPLPEDFLWAMVAYSAQQGDLVLAGLLIVSSEQEKCLRSAQLTCPVSQEGTRHNVRESVTTTDSTLVMVLEEVLLAKKQTHLMRVPIWPGSGTSFRSAFAKLTRVF